MGCHCGGKYDLIKGELRCVDCGCYSPHQPLPTYEQLLQENLELKEQIAKILKEVNVKHPESH